MPSNTYEIIRDEKVFESFICWLPELKETEVYYLCLFARSKYAENVAFKADKAQLKRFTSRKEDIFRKVRQLECTIGAYTIKDIPVPAETLALYITTNPRDLWKATTSSLVRLAQCIQKDHRNINPHQEVLSEIQQSKSRSCFVDFDFDAKLPVDELKTFVYQHINQDAVQIFRTRGGYHVLVMPEKVAPEYKNSWFLGLKDHPDIDQTGDLLMPVPGCVQGGFTPEFVY